MPQAFYLQEKRPQYLVGSRAIPDAMEKLKIPGEFMPIRRVWPFQS
jgi:hypothetical protein